MSTAVFTNPVIERTNAELKLWKEKPNTARTRWDKNRIAKTAKKLEEFAMNMERYANSIPEEENERHANLVHFLADEMENAWYELNKRTEEAIYNPKV